MDLMVIAALIVDTETVSSIHWISGNILAACVIGTLGLALNHVLKLEVSWTSTHYQNR